MAAGCLLAAAASTHTCPRGCTHPTHPAPRPTGRAGQAGLFNALNDLGAVAVLHRHPAMAADAEEYLRTNPKNQSGAFYHALSESHGWGWCLIGLPGLPWALPA